MQPAAPVSKNAPTPPGGDQLGNPVTFADIAVKPAPGAAPAPTNPIMASGMASAPAPAAPTKDPALDKDLKAANQAAKKIDKPKNTMAKPVIAITIAVLVGLGLCAAAYFAFSKSS